MLHLIIDASGPAGVQTTTEPMDRDRRGLYQTTRIRASRISGNTKAGIFAVSRGVFRVYSVGREDNGSAPPALVP